MRKYAGRFRRQDGFSLIELMLAIIVLAIAMGAVAMTLGSTIRHSTNAASRSVGSGLVGEEIDKVRQQARSDFTTLPLGQTVTNRKVDGVVYTVTRDSEWVSAGSTTDSCSATATGVAYLRVKVIVTWAGMKASAPANAETVLTPPVGAYDPTKGHVAVKVRDRDAVGEASVRVKLKQGATVIAQQDTASDGCAFFAYKTPGAYTIELNETGYVDGQSVQAPTQPVNIVEGTVTSIGFDYDVRAALYLTRVDATGSSASIPTNVGTMIAHPQLLPNKQKFYPTSSNSPQWIDYIFPYAAGYEAWAGGCADADPEGTVLSGGAPVPLYPGIDRDAAIPVLGGFYTPRNIRMASVLVRVTRADGSPLNDADVRLVHAVDGVCTSGETLTYSDKTDSSGLLRVALPLGHWTVQVSGRSPKVGTSWPQIDINPPFDDNSRPTVFVETNA